ncbi:hypothetical protein AN639_07975 [Candidatus Epulonipiscium fishelsonii]|uniref:Uncharacterized protein n=1 Tax=Candidatus Epulonipiscium fishelsonii TaxID=77094 RepID=A0ACC8X7T3_9FIRM|nr:hypothetical protein AN396_12685 [Epulopiscium sp. SCG-B11WGA-EpuloA1]ONI38327.1 hypothetical protein AN639_07975 [Epulopiscium sp. SCG-B05WGA-EpuloA1]
MLIITESIDEREERKKQPNTIVVNLIKNEVFDLDNILKYKQAIIYSNLMTSKLYLNQTVRRILKDNLDRVFIVTNMVDDRKGFKQITNIRYYEMTSSRSPSYVTRHYKEVGKDLAIHGLGEKIVKRIVKAIEMNAHIKAEVFCKTKKDFHEITITSRDHDDTLISIQLNSMLFDIISVKEIPELENYRLTLDYKTELYFYRQNYVEIENLIPTTDCLSNTILKL